MTELSNYRIKQQLIQNWWRTQRLPCCCIVIEQSVPDAEVKLKHSVCGVRDIVDDRWRMVADIFMPVTALWNSGLTKTLTEYVINHADVFLSLFFLAAAMFSGNALVLRIFVWGEIDISQRCLNQLSQLFEDACWEDSGWE